MTKTKTPEVVVEEEDPSELSAAVQDVIGDFARDTVDPVEYAHHDTEQAVEAVMESLLEACDIGDETYDQDMYVLALEELLRTLNRQRMLLALVMSETDNSANPTVKETEIYAKYWLRKLINWCLTMEPRFIQGQAYNEHDCTAAVKIIKELPVEWQERAGTWVERYIGGYRGNEYSTVGIQQQQAGYL